MKRFIAKPVFIVIAVLVVFSLVVATVDSLSGYSYQAKIFIENTTASDITTRTLVTVPAKNLVDNHYIQADAEDVSIEYSTEEKITAKNLTSNTATWILEQSTIPAYSTISKTMYFGNTSGTRNQSWIADDGDSGYAVDDSSLDGTSSIMVAIDQFVLSSTPTGEQEIVSKEGNYELVVDGIPTAKLKAWKRTAAPGTDTVYYDDITASSANINPALEADQLSYLSDADDGTYLYEDGGVNPWYFEGYINDATLDEGAVISSVNVYIRGRDDGSGPANGTVYPVWTLSGTTTTGVSFTLDTWYKTGTWSAMARPGGGSWSVGDFATAKLRVTYTMSSAGSTPNCNVSSVYVTVAYSSGIGTPYIVSIPVVVGTAYTLSGSFTGTLLGVSNGVTASSMALSGTLNANAEPLHVNEFNGKARGTAINKTPPFWPNVFYLEYEPDEISATVINDLSVEGNHVTYSLAANPAGITVTLDGAESTGEATYASESLETQDTLPDGANMGDSLTDEEANSLGSSNPLFPLADILHDNGNMPYPTAWMIIFLAVVILVASGIMKYTQHLWLAGISVAVIAAFFYAWDGLIPFYLVAMAVMAAIASVIMERRGTV